MVRGVQQKELCVMIVVTVLTGDERSELCGILDRELTGNPWIIL
jgi:hypothetical protein